MNITFEICVTLNRSFKTLLFFLEIKNVFKLRKFNIIILRPSFGAGYSKSSN